MDVTNTYVLALERFRAAVSEVPPDSWELATPCTGWTVRDLVNHVVSEDRWLVPLLAGKRIEDVGDSLDGDLLGNDPLAAVTEATTAAREALLRPGATDGKVHLSYGDETALEYAAQLTADHLIHTGDLTRAIRATDPLDEDSATWLATWFDDDHERMYRDGGGIGARRRSEPGDLIGEVLARFGRSKSWTQAMGVAHRFQERLDAQEIDEALELLAPDVIFEDTAPPDGTRVTGREPVGAYFAKLLADTVDPHFEIEEMSDSGGDVTMRTTYSWATTSGERGHVRGMELIRVRDGLITEMLAYVKG